MVKASILVRTNRIEPVNRFGIRNYRDQTRINKELQILLSSVIL